MGKDIYMSNLCALVTVCVSTTNSPVGWQFPPSSREYKRYDVEDLTNLPSTLSLHCGLSLALSKANIWHVCPFT